MSNGDFADLQTLVGAKVNYVRFGAQVDINFYGGQNRDRKYANLQIEHDFVLELSSSKYEVNIETKKELCRVLELLDTTVSSIHLNGDYILNLVFSNGVKLRVAPVEKYESWNLTGDDLAYYVAVGV